MLIIILTTLVLGFLLVLATKAFKSKSKDCNVKITVSLVKGFSMEFSTTNKKTPPL